MSVDRALEGWEGVQRQGHDIAERFTSLAQGLGCMLQSYVTSSVNPTQPSDQPATPYPAQQDMDGQYNDQSGFHWPWNWTSKPRKAQARSNRVQFNGNRRSSGSGSVSVDRGTAEERTQSERVSTGIHELGQRLGQAGADLGACLCDIVRYAVRQFHRPFQGDTEALPRQTAAKPSSSVTMDFHGGFMEWREVDESRTTEGKDRVSIGGGWKGYNHSSRHRKAEEVPQSQQDPNEFQDVSNEELFAYLTKSHGQFHKQQGSVSVTTTFDSRTQELESSVVARGDLWRAEASHGGNSSANGSSPLFLLQIGPILFVRDTTLLLPVHLSKQHLLWYGFDRKNGLHSLCPAVWSKHRRWLFMSMICLNPFTCSFMDLQFPNGQFTYVAGEGVTTSAFFHAFGGLLQVHSRQPGDTKLSFSHKTKWGTRLTPSVQLPEKSYSIGIAQPLAWQRSGLMVRPTIQLSVTPTFGGRNAGWRAELIHSPKEKLSWACGCAVTIQPSAFASISLGRSKHNGGHSGCSGLVLQVETPLENINRASFSIQLNSGVEF